MLTQMNHQKLLILLLAYVGPALILFFVKFNTKTKFLFFYALFSILQLIIYIIFAELWSYGLFAEQDTQLWANSFANVSINPILNFFTGNSNGALYLALLKAVQKFLPFSPIIIAVILNIFLISMVMVRLQNAINRKYESNSIWAMKYIAVAPTIHCYTFIALKDVLTMCIIGFLISILMDRGSKIKLILLSIALLLNRVLIGAAAIASISPIFIISIFPLLIFYLTNGNVNSIIDMIIHGGESERMIFPLSLVKFLLTPLPHSAVNYYPSQYPLIFHLPLTACAIIGFVKYVDKKVFHILVFLTLIIFISYFSPGNNRYRMMFEPFLAVGFSRFMQNKVRFKSYV